MSKVSFVRLGMSERPAVFKQPPLARKSRVQWVTRSRDKTTPPKIQRLVASIERMLAAEERAYQELKKVRELLEVALDVVKDQTAGITPPVRYRPTDLSAQLRTRAEHTPWSARDTPETKTVTTPVAQEVAKLEKESRYTALTTDLLELNHGLPWITKEDLDHASDDFHAALDAWLRSRCHRQHPDLHVPDVEGHWLTTQQLMDRIHDGWQLSIETRHLFPPDPPETPKRNLLRHLPLQQVRSQANVSALQEAPEQRADQLSRTLFRE